MGQTKNFQITGAGSFASQGGPGAGCGVPTSAEAVSVSLSARSTSIGYLTAFAQGAPKPGTNSVSFAANQTQTAGSIVALGATGQMSINVNKTATLYGDITGYYAPQIRAFVNGTNATFYSKTSRVLSASSSTTGRYTITIDRDLTGCVAIASSPGGHYVYGASTSGNEVSVAAYSNGVLAKIGFMLTVQC